jgi:aspartate aminotransferase
MFENLDVIPPDPILGLIGRFRDDPSLDKVDLGVGVYRDESGRTPVMGAVREAERLEVESASSKAYFGQAGNPAINPLIQELVLGPAHPATVSERAVTLQTPGGSGALRVAAELLLEANPGVRVWVPSPTWANHVPLVGAAGIDLVSYPYYDPDTATVDRDELFTALEGLEAGDVVLVHATCHNPTGADLTLDDFRTLAEIALAKGTPVLVDSAYQGLATGLEADAAGARLLVQAGLEVLICTSFSKNFGLYRDRAGALTMCGPSSRTVGAAFSNALRLVRTMYSTPPDHGPATVARILGAEGLRSRWVGELEHMRARLISLRHTLVDALGARGAEGYAPIADQRGMFSLLGIDENAARKLTDEYHIYLPTNGRINVAGISDANVDYVADAIVAVTGDQSERR